ncbi:hypothetical protein CKA32_002821 [Geitlerinema sp. FC II]|nr:hypothetical protein CKA32_002821 [Geitlerinema sp. FC II]
MSEEPKNLAFLSSQIPLLTQKAIAQLAFYPRRTPTTLASPVSRESEFKALC